MDKPDTSYLFDAKMELHSEEESYTQPIIISKSKTSNRGNGVLVCGIVVVVALIAGAFVAGYMIRSAVTKVFKCETSGAVSPSLLPHIRLREILAEMSAENIEHNLRYVHQFYLTTEN